MCKNSDNSVYFLFLCEISQEIGKTQNAIKTMKKTILLTALVLNGLTLFAQSNDEKNIKLFYKKALTEAKCYSWLEYLSNDIGSRLSGSKGAAEAVEYTKRQLESLGLDKVYLQEVMVPHWVRGEESATVYSKGKTMPLLISSLGNAVGTGDKGIKADVLQVNHIDEFKRLPASAVKGKIVFFNYHFDQTEVHTFDAYGPCVYYRWGAPSEAAIAVTPGKFALAGGGNLTDAALAALRSRYAARPDVLEALKDYEAGIE